MFNFTTQTILNKVVVESTANIKNGTAVAGYNVIKKDSTENPELRIGNKRFNKKNVLDIYKATHTAEALASAEIDLSTLETIVTANSQDTFDGDYRIAIYVGLSMNSQDALYSNAFVYKGKPFFIEFPVNAGDEAADVATRIVKIANKYLNFMQAGNQLKVTANEGKVTITAVNGYQQIKSILVQKYDPNAKQIDCCNNNGDFITKMKGVPVTFTVEEGEVVAGEETLDFGGTRELADDEFAILPGLEAFLDYNWIMHNLRLPTAANTNFWSPTKQAGELPVVGGVYNQYIVRLCVDRDGIAGGVVGQRATSVTTHVFYVLDDGQQNGTIKAFEDELKKVLPQGKSTFETDADTAFADPYANA